MATAPARVGIVGLGRMGSTIDDEVVGYPAIVTPYSIAAAATTAPGLTLACGCDPAPEKRAAFSERWRCPAVYDDIAAMVAAEVPDLVAICTRADSHAALACQAAGLGVPAIYCEKAVACSFAETRAIRAAAGPMPFATGVLRRYDDLFTCCRDQILGGRIGQPQTAMHYAAANLMHGHVHSIDTLLYLLGDPAVSIIRGDLRPRGSQPDGGRFERDPDAVYQFETSTGVSCGTVPAGLWEFEVIGTEGVLRIEANGQGVSLRRSAPVGARFQTLEPVVIDPPPRRSATVTILEELAAASAGGPLREGAEHACRMAELCLLVAESAVQGGRWLAADTATSDLYVHHV